MPEQRENAVGPPTIRRNPDGSITSMPGHRLTDEEQARKDREAALRTFLENDDPTTADKLEVLRILVQQKLNGEVL